MDYSIVLWASAVALLLCWQFYLAIYRLYWHPLCRFPGPKLAALTFFYEFYYDVIRSGMYIWEIERMHDKYGMSCSIPYSLCQSNFSRSNRPN